MIRRAKVDHAAQLRAQIGNRKVIFTGSLGFLADTSKRRSDPNPWAPIPVRVTATEDQIYFNRLWGVVSQDLLFVVAIADIKGWMIDDYSAARSSYGWEPLTGLLHRARQTQAYSAFVLELANGTNFIFLANGPKVQVRAQMAPLTSKLRTSEVKQAPTGVADEIRKLAELRDQGVLSEDEFQAGKAKLLG